MKNRFLGTTAMAAAALMLTGGGALGADRIRLGLGGHFRAYSAAINQAGGPASNSRNFGTPNLDDIFSILGNAVATPVSLATISSDSEEITYFTPRLSGFQLRVSHTPENCEGAAAPCAGTIAAGRRSEIIEIGANYIGKVGGIDMSLHAGIAKGELGLAAPGAENQDRWDLGVELRFAGFTFGADYRQDDQGAALPNTDRIDYSLGLAYVTGNWTIAAAYAHGEVEAGAGLGLDETDGYQIGVIYGVGPDIAMTGGITYWDVEDSLNAAGIENTSTALFFGTLLSF